MVFSRRAAEVFLAQSRSAVASVRGDRRETSGLSCALHTPTIHYIYVHVLRTCSRLSHHFLATAFTTYHGLCFLQRLFTTYARYRSLSAEGVEKNYCRELFFFSPSRQGRQGLDTLDNLAHHLLTPCQPLAKPLRS